jgi:hypothetical protein
MPCDSAYLAATQPEKALSEVASLLDELDGKPINPSWWEGYHPRVYNLSVNADAMVSELCSRLQAVDVTKYSLEMQMWWRDHQRADEVRLRKDLEDAKTDAAKRAALAKLTPHERRLLGLQPVSGRSPIGQPREE